MKTLADYPDIARQLHPTKNGSLSAESFSFGSNKKLWWQCEVATDHVWQASVDKRTISGRGCPFCSSAPSRASSTNNLALKHPDVAARWHPTLNKDVQPVDVLPSSAKTFWWLCDDGHHFQSKVYKRTSKPWSCPYCSGKRVGQGNSLIDRFPEIAEEWDYEKNGDVTPDTTASKSNKRFWFKCPLNDSYRTAVSYRTNKGTGCPNCTSKSSQQELRIYSELKWIFTDAEHRYRLDGTEFDVFIPSLSLGVEYDGAYWHRDSFERDRSKNDFCRKNNIELIRVRETPLPKLNESDINVPAVDMSKVDLDRLVQNILIKLDSSRMARPKLMKYLASPKFVNDGFFEKHRTYLAIPHPDDSLASKHPEICQFWDYAKNYPLKPEHFRPGSGKKVHWLCRKGHSFVQKINEKRLNRGCLICNSSSHRGRKATTLHDKQQGKLF